MKAFLIEELASLFEGPLLIRVQSGQGPLTPFTRMLAISCLSEIRKALWILQVFVTVFRLFVHLI